MLGRNYVTDLWWGQSVENVLPAVAATQHIRQQGLPPACYCVTASVENNRQFGVVIEDRPLIKPGVPVAAAYFVSQFLALNPDKKRLMLMFKAGNDIYFLATDEQGVIYPDSDKLFSDEDEFAQALSGFWDIYVGPVPELWLCRYTKDLRDLLGKILGDRFGSSEGLFDELQSSMVLFTAPPKEVLQGAIKKWQKVIPSLSYFAAGLACLWFSYNISFSYWEQVEERYERDSKMWRERAAKLRAERDAERERMEQEKAEAELREKLLEQAQEFVEKGPWPDAVPIQEAAPLCMRLITKAPADVPLWNINDVSCSLQKKALEIRYTAVQSSLWGLVPKSQEEMEAEEEEVPVPHVMIKDYFAEPRILGEEDWIKEEPIVDIQGSTATVSYPLNLDSLLAKPDLGAAEMSSLHRRGIAMGRAMGTLGLGGLAVGPITAWSPPPGLENVLDVIKELGHNYQYFTFDIHNTSYLQDLLIFDEDSDTLPEDMVDKRLFQKVVFRSALLNYIGYSPGGSAWRAGGLVYAQR